MSTSGSAGNYVTPTVSKKVGDGKFFVAGESITTAASNASVRVANPTGSGKSLFIVAISMYSDVTTQVQYIEDATLSGPTAITPRNLLVGSPATSAMTVEFLAGNPTGGTVWSNETRVPADVPVNLQFPPVIIAAGKSLSVSTAAALSATFTVNVYYYEE